MSWIPTRGSGRRRRGLTLASIVAALVLITLVAAACGGSAKGSVGTSGSPSPGTSASSPSGASGQQTVAGVTITTDAKLRALLPQAILSANEVRVACDIPYPPWEMFTAPGSNELTGIDYLLGQALGAKLGVPFVFQQTVFDSIIPALQAGKADIVMSAMYDNVAREKVLTFVDYAKDGTALLVLKGNPQHITDLASLAGKTVSAESGTTQLLLAQKLQAQFKAEGKAPLTILQYPKDSDAQLAVKSGKAVADVTDGPGSAYVAKTTGGGNVFEVVRDPSAPNGYDPQIIGAGMLKSNTQLRDAIQKALQVLIDEGSYTKILEHFGQPGVAVASAQVDLGK